MTLVKITIFNPLLTTLILFLFSCNPSNDVKINGSTMGTTYELTVRNFNSNSENLKTEIDSLLTDINNIFSTYIDDSEISLLNKSSSKKYYLSNEFKYVLNKALFYCELSNGNYDITINPLVELWGFGKHGFESFPDSIDIVNSIKNTGYKKILLKDRFVYKENNMEFDLNSLAKGYAVDRIYEYMLDKGINDFLIEIGGEVRCLSEDDKWIVGIQNPLSNSVIKKIMIKNKSLATSGTYNNYFEHKGIGYSHIINPKTGYPYKHKTISATIIGEKCIDVDALATLAMTMDPNDVIEIINKQKKVDCYILQITDNNEIIEFESDSFKDVIF